MEKTILFVPWKQLCHDKCSIVIILSLWIYIFSISSMKKVIQNLLVVFLVCGGVVYIFALMFGGSEGWSLNTTQIITYACTSDQDNWQPYNCGSYRKCWSWCEDQKTLVSNLLASNGKWCYTTTSESKNNQAQHCYFDLQCYSNNQCLGECSGGCWKSDQQEKAETIDKKVINKGQQDF